jgi:uroporphyrinogen-III synthase
LQTASDMQDKVFILSTRPVDDLVVRRAAEKNIIIECASFIQTEPVKELPENLSSLFQQELTAVFTSMNAAEAMIARLQGKLPPWYIFSMGHATKDVLLTCFRKEQVSGTASNASALAEEIIKKGEKEVFFFCGDQRRDELPDKLASANVNVKEIVVYETRITPVRIEKDYDAILFFSPSAVESFFSVNTAPPGAVLFSIGSTTKETIKLHSRNTIVVGDKPGKNYLVEKAMHYFNISNHINEQTEK